MRLAAILIAALMLSACGGGEKQEQSSAVWKSVEPPPPPVCVETARGMIPTYPNAGLMALGPQYRALALVPVFVESDVCVKWENP